MPRRTRLLAALVASAALGAAVVACGSSSDDGAESSATPSSTTTAAPATSAPPTTAPTTASVPDVPGQVVIRDYELLPPTITVAAGGTVTWQNADDVDHKMLTEDGTTVDSGAITPGQAYVATLATPGTFAYYCDIHNAMKGTIVVE